MHVGRSQDAARLPRLWRQSLECKVMLARPIAELRDLGSRGHSKKPSVHRAPRAAGARGLGRLRADASVGETGPLEFLLPRIQHPRSREG